MAQKMRWSGLLIGLSASIALAQQADQTDLDEVLEDSSADTAPTESEPVATVPVDPETPAKRRRLIEEIIVTARRTDESLQDVPMSVNVMDEEALIEKNIVNPNDVAQASPGLSAMNGFSRNESVFSIRGQGQIGTAPPGVLPYYAEVPDFSPFLYDLASLQVLKGPQGTLFGRNTTGGAILFTPNKPSAEYEGFVWNRLGNYGRSDLDFAVGGPLPLVADMVSIRIAGQILRQDPYTVNLDGPDLDGNKRESFRGSVVVRPFDQLETYTIYQHDYIDETGSGMAIRGFVDSPQTPNQMELREYIPLQKARGPRIVQHNHPDIFQSRQWGLINTTAWSLPDRSVPLPFGGNISLGNFTLKNIYRYSKGGPTASSIDVDGSPFHNIELVNLVLVPALQKNEELQLQYDNGAGLRGVIGGYYEYTSQGPNVLNVRLSTPGSFGTPQRLSFIFPTYHVNRSKAAFVQGSWGFLEDWDLTLGARYTADRRNVTQGLDVSVNDLAPQTTAPYTLYSLRSHAISWNVALDYRVTQDLKTYLTVRRGYKAGGFSSGTITSGNEAVPGDEQSRERVQFRPEYVTDYEAGIKSLWYFGDFEVRANVDAFFDDYTDIQRLITLGPPDNAPSNAVTNASKAKIWGADFDLLLVPWEFFDTAIQYTNLHTKYDVFDDPSLGDLSASKFPNTPEHQVSITPAIHWALPRTLGRLSVQVPFFYQSNFAINVNNVPNGNPTNDNAVPGSNKPGFTRWDFRIDWRNVLAKPLGLAFYVRNVLDSEYETGGIAQTGQSVIGVDTALYGAPRMYSLELRYDWGTSS